MASGHRQPAHAPTTASRVAKAATPLLATKLTAPRMPPRVVLRPRLFDLMEAGTAGPVTLVAAQAGAGKTTLLSSWSASPLPPGRVAWLSLDRADNEPVRFWSYVLAALVRAGVEPGRDILRTSSPRPGAAAMFLPFLVGGLSELREPVVLVLDDFHEIVDRDVLDGVAFLLRHAPPQLRLVIATRSDPPLPLHRLLVSGSLSQVRTADLAFTVAEVAELLDGDGFRADLTDDDLVMLQVRTQGWAAGLRLAALSLQRQPAPRRFVAEFAGDDQSVAGYLIAEVLDRQPADLRSFLLHTCIVGELNGDLANALTGRDDAERALDQLERTNAFVVALDSPRDWYRYHPLFADLLRHKLRLEARAEVPELRRRAATWYAANGRLEEAIDQASMVADWATAAGIIADHGLRHAMPGHTRLLRDLLDRLPTDAIRADPELELLDVAERILTDGDGEIDAELELVRQRQPLLGPDRRQRFARVLLMCRLAHAYQLGALDEVIATGQQVLAALRDAGPPATGVDDDAVAVAMSYLGAAGLWAGDLDAAEVHLREAHALALRSGLDAQQLLCLSTLGLLYALRGQFAAASQIGRAAVDVAERHGWSSAIWATGGHLALTMACHQRDDLVAARNHMKRAAMASGYWATGPLGALVTLARAQLRQAGGDLPGAFESLAAARKSLADGYAAAFVSCRLDLVEAEMRLMAGNTDEAGAVLKGLAAAGAERRERCSATEAVALARLELAEGEPAAAMATLAPVLDGAAPGVGVVDAAAWMLHALAADALDEPDRIATALQRAVELAEPEGSRRVFLDTGPAGLALLARYRDRIGSSWPFLDELAQDPTDAGRVAPAELPAVVEPLSERERVVLRYLPSMLSYVEIADELYISPHTIKSHARSIYRKLGADGRRDAVRRARQLDLLRS
jgi:LuxR family maltose regulon positive regulatory protein